MADDIPQMKEARPPLPLEFSLLWGHGSRASVEEGMNHEKHEIRSTGRFLIVIIGKKTKIESREKKVESSAWTLCSGLPSSSEKGEEGRR